MKRQQLSLSKAFSLIEAAIVLAVVGLVIGGIWVAAVTVRHNFRVSELSAYVLQASAKFQQTIPLAEYPAPFAAQRYITHTAVDMGIFPVSSQKYYILSTIEVALLPINVTMWSSVVCGNSATCTPLYIMSVAGDAHASATSDLSTGECTQLLRRVMATAKNLYRVGIDSVGTYTAPFSNIDTMACVGATKYIDFYFMP